MKPGSARSDFHRGAAAVQLPQRPPVCVSDGDVSPRPSLDRAEGDGVLIQPALFSPFRQDCTPVVDRPNCVERVLVLLFVSPLHFLGAALKLDKPVLGKWRAAEFPSASPPPNDTAGRTTTANTARGKTTNEIGIDDQRRARLRAPSRSVGTADGGAGHGSVSVDRQLCCRSRCTPARSAHQPHTAVSATSQPDHGSDHHADRRRQQGPRRAPRAA